MAGPSGNNIQTGDPSRRSPGPQSLAEILLPAPTANNKHQDHRWDTQPLLCTGSDAWPPRSCFVRKEGRCTFLSLAGPGAAGCVQPQADTLCEVRGEEDSQARPGLLSPVKSQEGPQEGPGQSSKVRLAPCLELRGEAVGQQQAEGVLHKPFPSLMHSN